MTGSPGTDHHTTGSWDASRHAAQPRPAAARGLAHRPAVRSAVALALLIGPVAAAFGLLALAPSPRTAGAATQAGHAQPRPESHPEPATEHAAANPDDDGRAIAR
ncbi:MAG: hypothetical protein R3B68_11685 [Phycisphaerales bacterium]